METTELKNFLNARTNWNLFVNNYVDVFIRALGKLQTFNSKLPSDEDRLSEILSAGLLEQACREILDETDILLSLPHWEKPIAPSNQQSRRNGQLGKRPDFTCVCPNARPGSHENYEFYLHIECKLLGKSTTNQRNYVVNGLQRFDSAEHQYGKDVQTGLMIGYILEKLPEEIQKEINKYMNKRIQYCPCLQFVFNTDSAYKHDQSFIRQHTRPAEFSIVHIWVDLRNNFKSPKN
jgi:hypothetical protein